MLQLGLVTNIGDINYRWATTKVQPEALEGARERGL